MFSLFRNRTKYVRARIWRNGPGFTYPENDLASLSGKADIGVAFSGGGTRSAAAVVGQLRGLKRIGLLKRIRYVSTVSGGSWGAVPYFFLPGVISDDDFLGEHLKPQAITIPSLKNIAKGSMLRAISDSVIADDLIAETLKFGGDESFSRAVGNVFLDPFGLDDNGRFMTFDDATLADALGRNHKDKDKDHHLSVKDFYVARKGSPFLIAGATLFTGQKNFERIHTEFTPYYSGTRASFGGSDPVGGGYVETLGYDSHRPKRAGSSVKLKLGGKRHRFAISDMIGTSGAAPQELLRKANLGFLGFPEFRHWAFKKTGGFSDDEELSFGDGGHIENLGIMPLLARKVKHIVVFINSKTAFRYNGGDPVRSDIASSVPNLFKAADGDGFDMNLVIADDDAHTKYIALIEAFEAAREAGQTLIHVDTYNIRKNKHYSVEAYCDVRICWIYNQDVPQWRKDLPFQTQKMICDGEVKRFPHYKTFFQNPPKVIDLSRAEAGLLAHLSCWNVLKNEAVLSVGV